MGIIIETKEEKLARSISGTPSKNNEMVLSTSQKESDFDDQFAVVIGKEQSSLRETITRCSEYLVTKSEKVIMEGANPTHVDQLLRISFWEEVSLALQENRNISERAIYSGVCSQSYWTKLREGGEDEKFTYLLIPVKSYARTNKLLLSLGQTALIEILNADPYVKTKEGGYKKVLSPQIAKVQLEAYKIVEERLYGKAVARIQTHNTNESKDSDANETIEALQNEIIALETKNTILIESDPIE